MLIRTWPTVVLIAIASCAGGGSVPPDASSVGATISFTTLVVGTNPGGDTNMPRLLVASNEKQRRVLEAAVSVSDRPAVERVNLSRDLIVAAILGLQPTSGYSITITEIQKVQPDLLNVTVRVRIPTETRAQAQAFMSPYHLVTIPRAEAMVRRYIMTDESGAILDQRLVNS